MGGIELHVRDLAAQQHAAGHCVEIATLTGGGTWADSPVPVHRPAGRRRPLGPWTFARSLLTPARYDVVHAHISATSPLAVLTARGAATSSAPVPTAVTVHSLWRGYTAAYRAADLVAHWSRWPVAWSAVSPAAAESVRRAAASPLDVAVVPNGIDLAAWARPRAAPRDGHIRIASVMRFAARKRPMPLLRMLRRLRERVPESVTISALLVGDGPARPAMQRYLDRHGMGWVELPGLLSRAEVAEHLARADVYVAPAILESFGIAALEAHLVGLPVVARRGTGIADFIVDGRDGFLCDSDDEMVNALAGLVRLPRRGRPPASRYTDYVNWPAVLRRTDALYAAAATAAGDQRPDVGAAPQRTTRTPIAS